MANEVTNFAARRAFEGPQIVLSWDYDFDGSVDTLRIVRRETAYPSSYRDGYVVVEWDIGGGPFPTHYSDRNIDTLSIGYYSIFWREDEDDCQWYKGGDAKALALATGYFAAKLWESLPSLYHIQDGET